MKSARPPAAESSAAASRRAQPVRQTRTNPPRTSSLQRGNSYASGPPSEQPIDIFPAITHFTDAMTALPKELVRHFTLLKEVDAKIFAPDAALSELLEVALKTPVPDPVRPVNDVSTPGSAAMSAHNSAVGPVGGVNPVAAPASEGSTVASAFDPSNVPRRQLFRQTAFKIQEMLTSLEEKNHVISTANDALQKQIGRIEEIWPHLETHFSDEAKWGSTTHWAYTENRQQKTNNAQAERSRREGAATLSAAAQALAEEAAARSNDRKQALAAKKNSRAAHNADADAEGKQQETGKKSQGAKSKKTAPTVADAANLIGLGISHTAPAATNPPPKRRKVANDRKPEPLTNTGKAERAMAGVFGADAPKPKTTSPRETPVPDGATAGAGPSKKRKALPTSSGQAKKSRTTAAVMSPSVVSSPLVGTFPDHSKAGRTSPPPLSNGPPRPTSSRARQNSAQTTKVDMAKERPGSAASNKPNGSHGGTPDIPAQTNGAKAAVEAKPPKGVPAAAPSKPEPPAKPEVESAIPPPPEPPAPNGSSTAKKEVTVKIPEDRDPKRDSATPILPPTPALKTKSGRASKPSTPALATFAEAQAASAASSHPRSRPSRNAEGGPVGANNGSTITATAIPATTTTAKRSHKKGASISAAAAGAAGLSSILAAGHPPPTGPGSGEEATGRGSKNGGNSKRDANRDKNDDDDDEPDINEPRYCICNQVSYGEMVGCDADGCPREWFHLECVGLEVAPKGKAKWYCEDCKKRLRIGERVGR